MSELLMKLKKDGGYILVGNCPNDYINGFGVWYSKDGKIWYPYSPKAIDPDEKALPYVCNDKNGDKVFAGDRVRRINGEPCIVEWFADECRYILSNNQNCYDIDQLELDEIELIKDKSEVE